MDTYPPYRSFYADLLIILIRILLYGIDYRGKNMSEKKDVCKWFGLIKFIVIVLFFISIVFIAIYPFSNRNLSIAFLGGEDQYIVYLTKDEIIEGNCANIVLKDVTENTIITKIRVFGSSKSLRLWEQDASGFYYDYYDAMKLADVVLFNKAMILPAGDVELNLGDKFVEQMEDLSKSFLQERLIYAELLGGLVLILLILLTVIRDGKLENNWDNHSPLYELKKFANDMKKYRQYMIFAAKADLKAEVANSYLNRLWWLLEPFFSMLVYVIVFGNVLGRSIENYSTFVFSALLMWNFFCKTLNYSVKLIRNNKDIVTKVYVPKFILLFSNMILNLYKLVFSLIVLIPMLIIFRVHIGIYLLWIIPAFLIVILLSFGLGMLLLHYGVYVDDLGYAVGILLSMLMFLSGTFYDVMTGLSYPLNALMLCLNPVAMCIDTMRNALLYNTMMNLPLIGVWFIISLLLCWLGVHIVYKNENSYVKVV